MARRAPTPDAPPEHPEWVSRFVVADWSTPSDDEGEWWLELVGWCGPDRTREILANGRWSHARRSYAGKVGLRLRDLPNPWKRR